QRISDMMVNFGEPAVFSCSYSGTPKISVTWMKKNNIIRQSEKRRLTTMEGQSILEILSVDAEDCGNYTCSIENEVGRDSCLAHLKSNVECAIFSEPPTFIRSLEPMEVIIGGSTKFECEVAGTPEFRVSWFRGDTELTSKGNCKITFKNNMALLEIRGVSKNDLGEYTCTVENEVGSITSNTILTVFKIIGIASDEAESMGVSLSHHRQVTVFYHLLSSLAPSLLSMLCLPLPASTPTIIPCTQVSARCMCSTSNPLLVKLSKSINHCSAPLIHFSFSPHKLKDIQEIEDNLAKLQCSIAGTPPFDITWCKNGSELSPDDYIMSFEDNIATLEFINLLLSDAGIYSCMATNEAGSASCTSKLIVKEKEGIPPPSDEDYRAESIGSTAPFECQVSPSTAQTNWLKDGNIIREGPKYKFISDGKDRKMTVIDVQLSDAGEYVCVAHLGKNEKQTKANLIVEGNPGPPAAFDITNSSVTLSWKPPRTDGGSPITGYIVERREKTGKWVRINKTPVLDLRYRAVGLYEGNEYEFRVYAENLAGLSKPSQPSDSVKAKMPILPPGPPINPKFKDKTRETVDMVWTKPNRDGGSPILGYIVECQKVGSTDWVCTNIDELISQCAYRAVGLTEGNEYRFRVKAVNVVGEGEPREVPETVIAKDILQPPEISLDLMCRDVYYARVGQTIKLSARVKGRPDPKITWSREGKLINKDQRTELIVDFPVVELVLKGAVRSDHGKYIITAKNSSGQATAPIIVNVLDKPGPCQHIKVSYVTKASAVVTWENPEDNGGTEITNYIVEYRQPNTRTWSIMSNREYFFRVCAENKVGPGPTIETKTPIIAIDPIERPGEPIKFHVAETGKTFALLKWKRPSFDGGSPNLSYHVERKKKDAPDWERVHKGSIKQTHYTVEQCIENQCYMFRVQTINEAGESDWVHTDYVIVKEDLQQPILELKLVDYWVEHTVVKDLSFNITGLKENKKYKFRVSARNSVGRGLPRETEGFLEVKEQLSKWMILPVAEEFLEIVNLSKLKFIMFCKMLKTILRLFFVNK
uniref:Titin n=1 Tax=Eptatretus burgeri TaxID=7764 RepID=A0A8C4QZJ6_EPTBU